MGELVRALHQCFSGVRREWSCVMTRHVHSAHVLGLTQQFSGVLFM